MAKKVAFERPSGDMQRLLSSTRLAILFTPHLFSWEEKKMENQDSYWFIDQSGSEPKMAALCFECAKNQPGCTRWDAVAGYGEYDVNCQKCNKTIYARIEDER